MITHLLDVQAGKQAGTRQGQTRSPFPQKVVRRPISQSEGRGGGRARGERPKSEGEGEGLLLLFVREEGREREREGERIEGQMVMNYNEHLGRITVLLPSEMDIRRCPAKIDTETLRCSLLCEN